MNPSTHWFFQCNTSAYTAIHLETLPPFAFLYACWRHVWKVFVFMASPPEQLSVKTCIYVKKALRYEQGQGINPWEQLVKCHGDVVDTVVRTRNVCEHGKRYSLAACDIYGMGSFSFLVPLYNHSVPQHERRWDASRPIYAGYVQERPVTSQNYAPHLLPFTISQPLAEMSTHCFIMQHSLWRKMRQEAYVIDILFSTRRECIERLPTGHFLDIPMLRHRQMEQDFRSYRIFDLYFAHERSVYLGFTAQRW